MDQNREDMSGPWHLYVNRPSNRYSLILIVKGMPLSPEHSPFPVILVPLFVVLDTFCLLFPAFRTASRAGKIHGEKTCLFRRAKDKRFSTLDTYEGLIFHSK